MANSVQQFLLNRDGRMVGWVVAQGISAQIEKPFELDGQLLKNIVVKAGKSSILSSGLRQDLDNGATLGHLPNYLSLHTRHFLG